jgi:hypothetical protein
MRRSPAILLSAASVVSVILLSMGAPSFANPNAAPTATESFEQHARAQWGLDQDLAVVRSVDRSTQATRKDLGIPLSPAESANIVARQRLLPVEAAIVTAASKLPGYAGVWVDQPAGGIIHVGVVGSGAAFIAGQLSHQPSDVVSQIQYDPATYPLAVLNQTRQDLLHRLVSDDSLRAIWSFDTVDVPSNRVVLTVLDTVSAKLRQQLSAEYGQHGLVLRTAHARMQPASRNRTTGKLYGGEWIENRGTSYSGLCTSGYSGAVSNSSTNHYAVTAGHCEAYSNNFYQGKAGGDYLGYVHPGYHNGWSLGGASNCDCTVYGPLDSRGNKQSGAVMTSDTGLLYLSYTAPDNYYLPGTPVCLSGAAYADKHGGAIQCGQMTGSADAEYGEPGQPSFLLFDAALTNIGTSIPGDSGAPYWSYSGFMGINAAGSSSDTIFSKAKYINGLGVHLTYDS